MEADGAWLSGGSGNKTNKQRNKFWNFEKKKKKKIEDFFLGKKKIIKSEQEKNRK